MFLEKLEIIGFRGMKNKSFNFDNGINVISGKNGIGKTTIVDAILWMLTDETLVYGKQTADNRNSNNVKDIVNVKLSLNNGVELERKYWDVWVEDEDGTLRYSRTENQFNINGAKYKKEEYFDYIRTMINLENNIKTKDFNLLRGIMDYNYFSSIDYKDARKFTEELLKLKSDSDILSSEKFVSIKTDMQLQKYDISKCLSKYQAQYKTLDEEIKNTQSRIELLESELDEKELERYNKLVSERNELISLNYQNNAQYLALNQSLMEIQVNIQEEEKAIIEQISSHEKQLNDLVVEGNQCNYNIQMLENKIQLNNTNIENIKRDSDRCDEELKYFKELKFTPIYCPHCQKIVNENEQIEFEEHKKVGINKLNNQIKNFKDKINSIEFAIKDFEKEIESIKNEKVVLGKKYVECKKSLTELQNKKNDNEKVKELELKKENIKKDIDTFIFDFNTDKNNKLIDITNQLSNITYQKNLKNQLEELVESVKQLKVKKATQETQIALVKEFKELKLQMIKENTSKVFPKLDFEIIEVNENTGAMKECCYTKLKGVEYKGVNDGHRKLVGIMLIEDIKRALGIDDLPIVFDKRADIDNDMLNKIKTITKAQIITTQVNEDKDIIIKGE